MLVDLNLLPAEYRRRALPTRRLLLLVAAAVALLLLYSLSQARYSATTEVAGLQSSLKRIQVQIEELKANEETTSKLQAAVAMAEESLQAMTKDYQSLLQGRVTWTPVLKTVYDALPPAVTIDQIVEQNARLVIQGKAGSYDAVVTYAKRLAESETFTTISPQLGRPVEQGGQAGASRAVTFVLTLQVKAGVGAQD